MAPLVAGAVAARVVHAAAPRWPAGGAGWPRILFRKVVLLDVMCPHSCFGPFVKPAAHRMAPLALYSSTRQAVLRCGGPSYSDPSYGVGWGAVSAVCRGVQGQPGPAGPAPVRRRPASAHARPAAAADAAGCSPVQAARRLEPAAAGGPAGARNTGWAQGWGCFPRVGRIWVPLGTRSAGAAPQVGWPAQRRLLLRAVGFAVWFSVSVRRCRHGACLPLKVRAVAKRGRLRRWASSSER